MGSHSYQFTGSELSLIRATREGRSVLLLFINSHNYHLHTHTKLSYFLASSADVFRLMGVGSLFCGYVGHLSVGDWIRWASACRWYVKGLIHEWSFMSALVSIWSKSWIIDSCILHWIETTLYHTTWFKVTWFSILNWWIVDRRGFISTA